MATLATRRAALAAALETGGISIADSPGRQAAPFGLIYGAGIDPRGVGRGQVVASFRVTLCAARADERAASEELGAMQLVALGVIRELAEFALGATGPDVIRTVEGIQYLTSDVACSAMVDLA